MQCNLKNLQESMNWKMRNDLLDQHRTLSQNSKCCIHCRNLSMPWPAHSRLRRGNCRGRPRFSFQSALSRPFHTSALASRPLPCCLWSSAACLLSLPVPALLRLVPSMSYQCPHVLPSTRYFLPCEMFHACFYTSSTQSPDALFSIVSKPPTRFL